MKHIQSKVIVKVVPAPFTLTSLLPICVRLPSLYNHHVPKLPKLPILLLKVFHGVVGHVSWLVINFVGYALDLRQVEEVRQHGQTISSVCTSS